MREKEPGLPFRSEESKPGSFQKESPCQPRRLHCTRSPPRSYHSCRCPAPMSLRAFAQAVLLPGLPCTLPAP